MPNPADSTATKDAAGKDAEGKDTENENRTEENGDDAGTEGEAFDEARAKEKIRKANAEAANLRKRLKDAEPILAAHKEAQEAAKSTEQKLTEERDEHLKRADSAEAENLRLRVALRKGLTEVQAKRLVGSTEEELEADADDLLESFGGAKRPADRPKETLRSGSNPDDAPEEFDARKLAAEIRGRR